MADRQKQLDGVVGTAAGQLSGPPVYQLLVDMGDGTHAPRVVQTGNVASGATDSGYPVKVGGVFNSTTPTLTNGQRGDLQQDSRGSLRTALMDISGTQGLNISFPGDAVANTVGGFARTIAHAEVWNGATWDRAAKPNSTARLLAAAASTNATSVKAAAGNVHKIVLNVIRASDCFLKLYNKASAPTVGTDTPVLTFLLPLSTKNVQIDLGTFGEYFSTGIAYALTTAAADSDTGALTAGDVTCMNIIYS